MTAAELHDAMRAYITAAGWVESENPEAFGLWKAPAGSPGAIDCHHSTTSAVAVQLAADGVVESPRLDMIRAELKRGRAELVGEAGPA